MNKCQRCGEVSPNIRRLLMRCFYDMNELGLPFTQETHGNGTFFKLVVCKTCRAEWMAFIQKWFNEFKPEQKDNAGLIPVRVMGTIKYMTEKEYNEFKQSKNS